MHAARFLACYPLPPPLHRQILGSFDTWFRPVDCTIREAHNNRLKTLSVLADKSSLNMDRKTGKTDGKYVAFGLWISLYVYTVKKGSQVSRLQPGFH